MAGMEECWLSAACCWACKSWARCSTSAALAGSVLIMTPLSVCAYAAPVRAERETRIARDTFFIVTSVEWLWPSNAVRSKGPDHSSEQYPLQQKLCNIFDR